MDCFCVNGRKLKYFLGPVFYQTPYWCLRQVQLCFGQVNFFYNHIEFVLLIWIFIQTGAVKSLGRTLQWRHNERDGISNHPWLDCLFNLLFRCRSKKTSNLWVTGLCEGKSPVTGEFPTQRASVAENASIWWCPSWHWEHISHHGT